MSYRTVFFAIAVATAGVLPAFMTGWLAVQIRSELGSGEGFLGLEVAKFFTTSALSSAVLGRVVERLGPYQGMRLAAAGSAVSLLGVALLARSWVAWGRVSRPRRHGERGLAHPATKLSLARGSRRADRGCRSGSSSPPYRRPPCSRARRA